MRDEDEGDTGLELKALQLRLHFLAQLQVESGQGLVQQQHLRMRRQRTRQGDPLLLAAGQLMHLAIAHGFQAHEVQHCRDPLFDLVPAASQHLQAEADVLGHVEMREKGVGLEDRVDAASERREVTHLLAVEQDGAAARSLEAGDQP